jgi:hypothetical protein
MFPEVFQPLNMSLPLAHNVSTFSYIAMCESIEILVTAVALLRRQLQKLFLNEMHKYFDLLLQRSMFWVSPLRVFRGGGSKSTVMLP